MKVWHSRHECPSRLRPRVGDDLRRWSRFDNAPTLHDRYLMGDKTHDREIMRNEDVGEAFAFLQISNEFQDLAAYRLVKRGDWLIEHDQRGARSQRAGDGDTLAFPA